MFLDGRIGCLCRTNGIAWVIRGEFNETSEFTFLNRNSLCIFLSFDDTGRNATLLTEKGIVTARLLDLHRFNHEV
jgi:hypothetical protein